MWCKPRRSGASEDCGRLACDFEFNSKSDSPASDDLCEQKQSEGWHDLSHLPLANARPLISICMIRSKSGRPNSCTNFTSRVSAGLTIAQVYGPSRRIRYPVPGPPIGGQTQGLFRRSVQLVATPARRIERWADGEAERPMIPRRFPQAAVAQPFDLAVAPGARSSRDMIPGAA